MYHRRTGAGRWIATATIDYSPSLLTEDRMQVTALN